MFERLKEFITPTKKTKYVDHNGNVVDCRCIEKNKPAGVCVAQKKAIKVRNIRDISEIKSKFDLIPPVEKQIFRDYSRIKFGAKVGIIGLGALNPTLIAQIKPLTDFVI